MQFVSSAQCRLIVLLAQCFKARNTCRSERATVHDCTENVPGLTFLMFLGFVETIVFSERNCVVV